MDLAGIFEDRAERGFLPGFLIQGGGWCAEHAGEWKGQYRMLKNERIFEKTG